MLITAGPSAPGALAVWTRAPQPPRILHVIEGWLAGAGFEPAPLIAPPGGLFGVGSARLTREPPPFRPGEELFTFLR